MFQTCACHEADASESHGAQYESGPVGPAVATVRLAEAEPRREGPLVPDCQGGNRSQRWKCRRWWSCRLNLVAKANFSPPSCNAREGQEGVGGEIPTSPSLVYSFECLSIICLSICRSHLSSCAGGQAEEDLSKMEQGAPMAASAGGRGRGMTQAQMGRHDALQVNHRTHMHRDAEARLNIALREGAIELHPPALHRHRPSRHRHNDKSEQNHGDRRSKLPNRRTAC